MVKPSERRLNKKFVRLPGGKTKIVRQKEKTSKPKCAVTKKPLQGTARGRASEVRKLAKTKRRPSILFGGILGSNARSIVFEEAIKVKTGVKKFDDVNIKYRQYVLEAYKKIGN